LGHEFDGKCGICLYTLLFAWHYVKIMKLKNFIFIICEGWLTSAAETPQLWQIRHVYLSHSLV